MTLLPTVYSIERGTTFQAEFAALQASGIKGPNDASLQEGRQYKDLAIPLLLAHPKALLLSAVNSGIGFFTLDGVFDFLRHITIRPPEMLGKPSLAALLEDPIGVAQYFGRNLASPLAFILIGRIVWWAVTILFLFGCWRLLRARPLSPHALIAILIVLYVAATSLITGYGLTARYRLPVNALVTTIALVEVAAIAPVLRRTLNRLYA